MNSLKKLVLIPWLLAPLASLDAAELKLAGIFSDHMILQRDKPVPIWGWANSGEKVTVEFAGQTKTATVDANGKWLVKLDAMAADTKPHTLKVNSLAVSNVLVGEVWLASGQSNMGYRLSPIYDAAAIAAADHPELRVFSEESEGSLTPLTDCKGRWEVSSPKTAPGFTAVGYYFAEELRRELKVPVGVVRSSLGGTQGESWLSREAQVASPVLKDYCEKQIDAMTHFDENAKVFEKALPEWEAKVGAGDPGNAGLAKGWAKAEFDDSGWKTCPAPVSWRQVGLKSGCIVWLRKSVDIPADKAGKSAAYIINGYDEDMTPYFNGQELKPFRPKPPRFFHWWAGYSVPGNLVKAGRNVIALRIHSHTESGGMWARPSGMLDIADKATTDNTWRYCLEARFPELTREARASLPKAPQAAMMNTASALFNGKIHPLIPYAIRGAIWYQGESNTNRGTQYAPLLTALIGDWRARWGQGDFPFYIVQLANYGIAAREPDKSGQAEVREGQLQVSQNVPRTGLAVAIDLGEENIHPRNKLDVGRRLALQALAKTYGRAVPCESPVYRSMKVEGNSIRIGFHHVEGGLVAKGESLKRFAIAGADQKFVWADAKLDGNTVLVNSPQVPVPVAVRYAWAANPEGCNLYNSAGLPASPFRTDRW